MGRKRSIPQPGSRPVEIREDIKVVTRNDVITARGMEECSLKAKKLFFIAISQCKQNDNEFYEYNMTVQEFAKIIGCSIENVYREIHKVTDELFRGYLMVEADGYTTKYTLFSLCKYGHGIIYFKMNPDMTQYLLQLKRDFTQPLLMDFMGMHSRYSIDLWHLMQREMHSRKPGVGEIIEIDLSVKDIRDATGTYDKFEKFSNLKQRVLDVAIADICENCNVQISYTYKKEGRKVVGLHFVVTNFVDGEIKEEWKEKAEEGKRRIRERNNNT